MSYSDYYIIKLNPGSYASPKWNKSIVKIIDKNKDRVGVKIIKPSIELPKDISISGIYRFSSKDLCPIRKLTYKEFQNNE